MLDIWGRVGSGCGKVTFVSWFCSILAQTLICIGSIMSGGGEVAVGGVSVWGMTLCREDGHPPGKHGRT